MEAPQLENISFTAKRGSDSIAFEVDYYVLAPNTAAVPDLSTWAPSGGNGQQDLWAQLPANLYLALPPAPPGNPAAALQLPADGTPPPFDALLAAVNAILALDPGPAAVTATVVVPGAAGFATQLPFGAAPAGIIVGMTASGAGITPGSTVVAIAGGLVTLSEQVAAAGVAAGTVVSFKPNLGALTRNQSRNIAYEMLWSQQGPLPSPPPSDPIENLYTNPPNTGNLTSGSSLNQQESDRQQFEAQLKTYYTSTNANANRLTNYVYALSAAVACEQTSLAATLALIRFPGQPDTSGTASTTDQSVILTALDTIAAPAHFGVPAAYFYALAVATPPSRDAKRRYADATGAQLTQVLSTLTAAMNAKTVTDAEGFVDTSVTVKISAAQAARRLGALDVPRGSSTALAPLDTVALATTLTAASGTTLTFASVAELKTGLAVTGRGIAPGTTVMALGGGTVTLSAPLLALVPSGTTIIFTPAYSAAWQALIAAWLSFPAATIGGGVSSNPTKRTTTTRCFGRTLRQPTRTRFGTGAVCAHRWLHHPAALCRGAGRQDPRLPQNHPPGRTQRCRARASVAGAVDHAIHPQSNLAAAAARRDRRAARRLHRGAAPPVPGRCWRTDQRHQSCHQRHHRERQRADLRLHGRRPVPAVRLERRQPADRDRQRDGRPRHPCRHANYRSSARPR